MPVVSFTYVSCSTADRAQAHPRSRSGFCAFGSTLAYARVSAFAAPSLTLGFLRTSLTVGSLPDHPPKHATIRS